MLSSCVMYSCVWLALFCTIKSERHPLTNAIFSLPDDHQAHSFPLSETPPPQLKIQSSIIRTHLEKVPSHTAQVPGSVHFLLGGILNSLDCPLTWAELASLGCRAVMRRHKLRQPVAYRSRHLAAALLSSRESVARSTRSSWP